MPKSVTLNNLNRHNYRRPALSLLLVFDVALLFPSGKYSFSHKKKSQTSNCYEKKDITCVFLETDGKRRFPDLFFEEIFLVEKENNRRIGEPLVVADRVEQLEALLHPIL